MEQKSLDRLKEEELAKNLRNNLEKVQTTRLKTDERVLARVTDGIYRQPGSALRELISNAYDADATRVTIRTDAPRFKSMTIEDNGHGMSPEALSYVIHHIGGSSKRNEKGATIGVTQSDDFNHSPKGRHLIGKIGIGLFSVAQLTQSFQIITKEKGANFRTIATVALKQFSEKKDSTGNNFETGIVNLWTEKAQDVHTHGTTIILNKIRAQTRETLTSKGIWESFIASLNDVRENGGIAQSPPKYHIGRILEENEEFFFEVNQVNKESYNSVPWTDVGKPGEAFKKLVRCVWEEIKANNPKPKLEEIFDNYLCMIWNLALSVPVKYVEKDILSIPYNEQFYPYLISNQPKGQATPITIQKGQTLSDVLKFKITQDDDFEVFIDEFQLLRPLLFENLPTGTHAVNKPMVFIGNCHENFGNRAHDISGGPLKFKAYIFWNSKIAPVEHQGVMIRIHDASGTLFDQSFMKYQVQEITRKTQLTCEIFIDEGLDSALNIDRESYNFSHPHVVFLTRWLHSALRQFANANKAIAKSIRDESKNTKTKFAKNNIQNIAQKAWEKAGNDVYQNPPSVSIYDDSLNDELDLTSKSSIRADYVLDFTKNKLDTVDSEKNYSTQNRDLKKILTDEKIKAITIVLASYGALDGVEKNKRNEMIYSIYEIISAED